MKRILVFIVSTILLLNVIPVTVFAENTETIVIDNLTWTYDVFTQTLTISGDGTMLNFEKLHHDDYIDGNTSLPKRWMDEVVTVIIEDGVSSIGNWAFQAFTAMESIIMPETLTMIGYGAFDDTLSLEYIEFPASLAIFSDVFYTSEPPKVMVFKGDAPTLKDWTGFGKTVTMKPYWEPLTRIYYPEDNISWTEEIRNEFGDRIVWNNEEVEIPDVTEMFVDVTPDAWYIPAIQYVFDNSLMIGTSEITFSPLIKLTREQLMQVFFAMEGLDKADYDGETGFTDVSEGRWYSPAVKWAKAEGITNGIKEDTFGIGQYVTREQLATFIMNYVKYKNGDITSNTDLTRFSDADTVSDWAVEGIEFCVEKGIINGRANGTLDPRTPANRAELAQILMQYAVM